MANSFDSSKKDHGDQNGNYDSDDQVGSGNGAFADHVIIQQCRIDRSGDSVDLCGVAGTKYSEHTECCEQISQPMPFFAKPVLDVIHGTAYQFAVGIDLAVVYRQGDLSIFGTHAKQCRNPHPEYGSGTADCDSACYTGNIASTDRGCKCCTHCLERRDSTVRCVAFAENTSKGCFDCVGEFADLKKIGADTKIKTNSENTDHCRNAPDKIIYSGVDGFDYLQHKIPLWKFFWMYVNGTASMSHTLLNWCSQSLFEKSFLQSARPLCGKFCPNSVAVACYGALIRAKTPTNCDAHLAKSLF